jgi:hypothetical protein
LLEPSLPCHYRWLKPFWNISSKPFVVDKHFHINETFVFISIHFACVIIIIHLSSYELLIIGYSLFSDRGNCVC